MEKYFGNAYRGDPGVPHCNPMDFWGAWAGAAAFSAVTWVNPYIWHFTTDDNYHDKAMLYEHHHWKRARDKNKPHRFEWNKTSEEFRQNYYFNWPVFFK
nr:uncharacterized protein LOC109163471 [Ipomoea trifida]GMC46309.1 actin T1-like protein [Ipomoea batatas]GMD39088.1 actin T1-like protein [Ipomoea batatas]